MIRITSDGRVTGELFGEQIARSANLDPIWRSLQALVRRPLSYLRPDRYSGGNVGPIQDDPGYSEHMTARVLEHRLEIVSTRPYPPLFNRTAYRKIASAVARYIVTGKTTVAP